MEYSDKGFIAEVNIERGLPPPDWINREPGILPRDEFYLEAFSALSSCRYLGMSSFGAIPWRDIVLYAEYHELEPDVFKAFVFTMRAMDKVYLDWIDKKQKREAETNKSKPKRKGRPTTRTRRRR